MAEHTPTPWIIRSQVKVGKNRDGFYLAPDEICAASAWASNQANAAFIVKAVNNHDALVMALQSASTQCGNVIFNCEQSPADNERHMNSWRSVKEFIDQALAKASP